MCSSDETKTDVVDLTIRHIDEVLWARLRARAAQHRCSMEEEARNILQAVLSAQHTHARTLVGSIRRHIDPLGGVELEIDPREPMRDPLGYNSSI